MAQHSWTAMSCGEFQIMVGFVQLVFCFPSVETMKGIDGFPNIKHPLVNEKRQHHLSIFRWKKTRLMAGPTILLIQASKWAHKVSRN